MKHIDHFDTYLRDVVNLPQSRLDQLEGRVNSIYNAIQADDALGHLLSGKTPQGSWAHRTIIRPLEGKEYDADVLVHMEENDNWDDEKAEYIEELYRALGRVGYDNRHRKTRCVRVQYANDCHVDLVPYVTTWTGAHIVNRSTGQWEETNPEGFTEWMNQRDRITNGNFRKIVRLMKYLRDHKNSFTGTRSIILTTLLGERVSTLTSLQVPTAYANVPTTLVTLVEDLVSWLEGWRSMPPVEDPSSPGTTFEHRWSEESFQYFKTRINVHADQMRAALDETDPDRSLEKWRELFGDRFGKTGASSPKSPFLIGGVTGPSTSAGRSGRAG